MKCWPSRNLTRAILFELISNNRISNLNIPPFFPDSEPWYLTEGTSGANAKSQIIGCSEFSLQGSCVVFSDKEKAQSKDTAPLLWRSSNQRNQAFKFKFMQIFAALSVEYFSFFCRYLFITGNPLLTLIKSLLFSSYLFLRPTIRGISNGNVSSSVFLSTRPTLIPHLCCQHASSENKFSPIHHILWLHQNCHWTWTSVKWFFFMESALM